MLRIQIAKAVFLNSVASMKQILDLGKYKLGKDSEDFIYYKQQVMFYTYDNLKKLYKQFSDEKIIEKCPKKCSLRKGYSDCLCGGSGFINYEK